MKSSMVISHLLICLLLVGCWDSTSEETEFVDPPGEEETIVPDQETGPGTEDFGL